MNNKALDCPAINEYLNIIDTMYHLGWDERNGGNVSIIIDQKDVETYFDNAKNVIREISLPLTVDPLLEGKVFAFTGTGRYFRNTKGDPSHNIGVFKIKDDLKTAQLLYGFEDDGCFTSEIYAHLLCHATRLKIDPKHHVVMHTHPTNLLIMSHVHDLDEKSFTVDLWRSMSECIVVFPEGVGVLPWMLCGTNDIGEATAKKMNETRVVVWALHGVYGCGESIDEAFGLIETVEKGAELYLGYSSRKEVNIITDSNLKELADAFHIIPHEGYLR